MRAIVLAAGQGKRLLPLTMSEPKCLLPVDGERPALGIQLRALANNGVDHVTILVGFGADRVEHFIASNPIDGLHVETLYNPFYATTDNLITCWLARGVMTEDFLILNGDTLFEDDVLHTLLEGPRAPITVTVNHKREYDEDDMKVTLDSEGRLRAIGKKLALESTDAESIGILLFRDQGVMAWREALERTVRHPDALNNWYLSVVNTLAQTLEVRTTAITGMWWQEIDCVEDLEAARNGFARRDADREPTQATAARAI